MISIRAIVDIVKIIKIIMEKKKVKLIKKFI
jgi:hypothetical protein